MKKLLLLFVCLFTLQTIARADDDKPIQVSRHAAEGTAVHQTTLCRQQHCHGQS